MTHGNHDLVIEHGRIAATAAATEPLAPVDWTYIARTIGADRVARCERRNLRGDHENRRREALSTSGPIGGCRRLPPAPALRWAGQPDGRTRCRLGLVLA